MFWEHYSSSFACISFQNHRNQTRFLSFFLAWSHIDFVHGRYWYFFPPPFDRRLFVRTAAALVRLQAFDTVIVSHSYTSGSQMSMTHGQVQTGLPRRNVVRVPKLLKSQHTAGTKQVPRKTKSLVSCSTSIQQQESNESQTRMLNIFQWLCLLSSSGPSAISAKDPIAIIDVVSFFVLACELQTTQYPVMSHLMAKSVR